MFQLFFTPINIYTLLSISKHFIVINLFTTVPVYSTLYPLCLVSAKGYISYTVLTSNMSGGKVYRAQVKPVKRSNMIPISNGTATGNVGIKPRENGEHNDHSGLSSSLDKEKK